MLCLFELYLYFNSTNKTVMQTCYGGITMFRKRLTKRKLKNIGKQDFNFDYDLEKNIYYNLCAYHLKSTCKNLPSHLQFKSYHHWEQYIVEKYNKYDRIGLIEFEKYLNQLVRLEKPIKEYWNIIISISLSSFFSYLITYLTNLVLWQKTDIQNYSELLTTAVRTACVTPFVMFIIILVTYSTLEPLYTEKMKISFLKDYQKVIKKLIKDKK